MTDQELQEMYEFYQKLKGAVPLDFVEWLKSHRHNGNDFPPISYRDLINLPGETSTGEIYDSTFFGDANLVAYYRMENVADAMYSRNLGNNGGVTFATAGKYNNGANFGASNSSKYLNLPTNNLGVDTQGPLTISCWVKILTEPALNTNYFLVTIRSLLSGKADFILTYQDVAGTKRLFFNRSKSGVGDQGPTYSTTLGTTAFHHLAFTYNGSNIHGYLDGVDVTGASAASGDGSGGADSFGVGASPTGTDPSSVIIDDLAIFTRVLTADEILSLAS